MAYWAFDYDNAQFLELGSGYSYSYYPQSNGEKSITTIMIDYGRSSGSINKSQYQSTVNSVLATARNKGSDYEKLKYIHDWIINHTSYYRGYTEYEYIREADGPVVYGQAVCEGYSKTFMYLAQSLGFECVCVAGISNGDHMWNMVKLNGQWYNIDVTWDDPIMSDGSNVVRYNYFLISDSQIRYDHVVDNPFTVPSAPQSYAQ